MLNVLTEKEIEDAVESKPVGTPTEIRRMRVWLEERVARGRSNYYSEVVSLTPVLASLLLEKNDGNRNIFRSNCEAIKNDILGGRWMFNGESIVVSATGRLLDGQHRCEAVIQTKTPIMVTLAFGAKDEARFTIDIGKPKSAANFLHMKGYTDTNNLAATIALILEYQKSGNIPHSFTRATKTQIVQSADDLKGVQASVDIANGATKRGLGSRSILAFCHYVFKKRAGVVAADEFMTKLIDGDSLRKGDPIYHLRDRLLTMRGNTQPSLRAAIVFRAWNHWRLGETVTKIVAPAALPKLER
jgi:hypothetical protein